MKSCGAASGVFLAVTAVMDVWMGQVAGDRLCAGNPWRHLSRSLTPPRSPRSRLGMFETRRLLTQALTLTAFWDGWEKKSYHER
ncbi:hypothetical protein B0T16DRAFT_46327 [Cercophora newfieldiana]|uniref:Secreted protein n=1 Tax=Cercophora newfieldiana TaxID=92897 RepID=A0AA39YQH7_9PEZI|nr:hypothetical protein B0T16DRAFT_46327 [Cercophora newfieldiana]